MALPVPQIRNVELVDLPGSDDTLKRVTLTYDDEGGSRVSFYGRVSVVLLTNPDHDLDLRVELKADSMLQGRRAF